MIHYVFMINCALLHVYLEIRPLHCVNRIDSAQHCQDSFAHIMASNVTAKVIEYLSKKGYSRTEAMLRMESANQDAEGRPLHSRSDESGGAKYGRAFGR